MAKRLVVLTTVLAAMLAMAVPAMAQEGAAQQQYDPEAQQQPGQSRVGKEFSGFGVVERVEGGFGLALSPEEAIYLEGDADFAAFEGQDVYVSGRITNETPVILTVEQIEPVAGEAEELSVTGVVEEQGAKADGTTIYGVIDEATGQGYALEGDFDFAAFEGQRVTAYGAYEAGGGAAILRVLNIEPTDGATTIPNGSTTMEGTTMGGTTMDGDTTTMGGTTMGGTTGPAEERYEDGGTPEQVGIDVNEDGVVDEADGEFAVQTSDEGVASTPDEGALPGTGGLVLPVAGLAGALLISGGLLFRNRHAR